ncbi:unnamed protein product [Ostreobium quekettii]|uniref:Uncharacterized protein n=1 Tax=Ostreobium quekettii TaxID=121088 RepID=A0A8S1ILW8_9CHLO|nr:unnamed protein product [Ostreobium quekettii]
MHFMTASLHHIRVVKAVMKMQNRGCPRVFQYANSLGFGSNALLQMSQPDVPSVVLPAFCTIVKHAHQLCFSLCKHLSIELRYEFDESLPLGAPVAPLGTMAGTVESHKFCLFAPSSLRMVLESTWNLLELPRSASYCCSLCVQHTDHHNSHP